MTRIKIDGTQDYEIINVKADIHPDGDVYIWSKKRQEYVYVGYLNELEEGDTRISFVPGSLYLKVKKLSGE